MFSKIKSSKTCGLGQGFNPQVIQFLLDLKGILVKGLYIKDKIYQPAASS